MPFPEVDRVWQFTAGSTAAITDAQKLNGKTVREWTVYAEVPTGSTAAFEMLTAASTGSTSVSVVYGSSQALNSSLAGQAVVLQFTGPLAALWPRCISLTASVGALTVRAIGN